MKRNDHHRVRAAWQVALLWGVLLPLTASGADHSGHMAANSGSADRSAMWRAALQRAPLSATGYFDQHGTLWVASVQEGHLQLVHSSDSGMSYSAPVQVNAQPEAIAADGENRPKIAVDGDGILYLSWTRLFAEKPFSGDIRFSRSSDGGKSFSPPVTVNDNREVISHRFDALGVNQRGELYIAWLDKRDQSSAQRAGQKYDGAALYYAVSRDGGRHFDKNVKVVDHSCECCRVAMAMDRDGVPVVLWRHVYDGNVRDHALQRLDGRSTPQRATHDAWRIDACPHHGPALAIGSDGNYHQVWFSGAEEQHGLFYARSADQGKSFSTPLRFGNDAAQAGHADVLSRVNAVFIVWKEFDGNATLIRMMRSTDNGQHWDAPQSVATSHGPSDHPLLIADRTSVYLSWNTAQEGYRLIALGSVEGK
ncbi:MAG TPA: sialidase family protein [Gammaproteobacteria bacterium]